MKIKIKKSLALAYALRYITMISLTSLTVNVMNFFYIANSMVTASYKEKDPDLETVFYFAANVFDQNY